MPSRMMSTKGPLYQSMERKLNQHFSPLILEIQDESHLHAHHLAMKGKQVSETHFK